MIQSTYPRSDWLRVGHVTSPTAPRRGLPPPLLDHPLAIRLLRHPVWWSTLSHLTSSKDGGFFQYGYH